MTNSLVTTAKTNDTTPSDHLSTHLIGLVYGAGEVGRQVQLEGDLEGVSKFASALRVPEPLDVDTDDYWYLLE